MTNTTVNAPAQNDLAMSVQTITLLKNTVTSELVSPLNSLTVIEMLGRHEVNVVATHNGSMTSLETQYGTAAEVTADLKKGLEKQKSVAGYLGTNTDTSLATVVTLRTNSAEMAEKIALVAEEDLNQHVIRHMTKNGENLVNIVINDVPAVKAAQMIANLMGTEEKVEARIAAMNMAVA